MSPRFVGSCEHWRAEHQESRSFTHRNREPLGPTLLVLQLLLREESLSPQGVGLIRMLQRNIKEEVRAITDLLVLMRTFLEKRSNERPEQKSDF